ARPPVGWDDSHRELERASIEQLGELDDRHEVLAKPLVLYLAGGLSRRAAEAQSRTAKLFLERLGLVEHAAPPVETAVELHVAVEDLGICARVDHHGGPASEHLPAVAEK